jgi:AsmA protein
MKKLLFTFIGIIVLLAAAIIVGPSLVDLHPRIAAMVREATGRELRIDGELRLALLPKLRVSASGVHLSNAPGAAAPDMLSVDSVALEAELWPLLGRRLVVNSLVVNHPAVNLEVDKTGRPNWEFAPQAKADSAPPQEKPEAAGGPPLAGVRLGELRVEQGQLSYHDDVTGQAIDAKDATFTAAMAELESPLSLNGRMVVNDEPVAADISVDTVGKLRRGEQAGVKLAVIATHLTARFDGAAQQRPVPGLDGVFDLDIPSVGNLASWLKAPLDDAQPDPGPLKVHAVFASEGTKSLLKEATVAGTALNAKASGSLDASGDATRLTAIVETGVLDVDRYLPPQARDKTPAPPAAKAPGGRPAPAADPLAALSDQPFDLAGLRRLDADVKVSIAGIKAMGYEVGRVAFAATVKAGVLAADLAEIALYGGTVKGTAKLDAAGDALGLDTALNVDRVTVDKLAGQAAAAGPPVSGVVSASLDAKARGRSPRALAEDMRGHLAVDLGGVTVKDAAARAISQLKLDVDLPGADKAPSLKASVVYNGERIDADASLAPLGKLASGERFPAKLAVDSKLATLLYDGTMQQRPVPGLDGTFDVDVPSMGKLAAWAGQPLDAKQPDPGPLKLHAALASDGAKLALKDAALTGKAVRATAQATFDGGRKPATFDAKIDLQQADLDAYLPPAPTPAQPAAKPVPSPASQPREQPPAGWSTEPFDLAALGEANGKAEITLAAVRYRGLDITKGALNLALAERALKLTAEKLALAQGTIDSTTTLDASGGGARLDHHVAIAGVQARPLLKAFAGSDRIGGTIEFETTVKGSGRNQKELISSLDGTGHFKVTDGAIYGVNLAAALRQAGSLSLGGAQTEKTDFAELSGSYTIKSGIIDNRDMKMLAPVLRLSGSGTVPMPPQTVDYEVEAKLVPSLEGQGGRDALAGVPIPIRITGPWSNPSYQPDWSSVFQTMAKDPERLKNLPGDLGKAAKEFGVPLPGTGGAGTGLPADITKKIPSLPSASPPSDQNAAPPGAEKKSPNLPFELPKKLLGK